MATDKTVNELIINRLTQAQYDAIPEAERSDTELYFITDVNEDTLTKTEATETYLPLSGGTMTGALGFGEGEYNLPQYGIVRSGENLAFVFNNSQAHVRFNKNNIYSWADDHLSIGVSSYKLKNVYTHKLNNSEDIIVPSKAGTLALLEDIPDTSTLATKDELNSKIPAHPTDDGTYVLSCSVVDGVATYTWESMA